MTNEKPATSEKICQAAIGHFADYTYDATPLNAIADAVGIRKASLYAHYPNKDALYLHAYATAVEAERHFAQACFQHPQPGQLPGMTYCVAMPARFTDAATFRFLMRAAYLPPVSLIDRVQAIYEPYLHQLQEAFSTSLSEEWPKTREHTPDWRQLMTEAYLGIVDSLHVELLYTGGRRFPARLEAMSRILATALAH